MSEPPRPPPRPKVVRRVTPAPRDRTVERARRIERVGGRIHPLRDFYYRLMQASWPTTLGIIFCLYMTANLLFAVVYTFMPGGVTGARPGNFEDSFYFSVQTLATIGYGAMSPVTRAAHMVVTVEAFCGLLAATFTTGLVFAKFSRPTARVLFTRNVVISRRDGVPTLQFRMANARETRIVQAGVRVVMARLHVTLEGERIRKLTDLKLVRSESAMFFLTWLAFHEITPESPFYGLSVEDLKRQQVSLIVTLVGIDEMLSQTVHARHTYEAADFVFGARFVDVITDGPNDSRILDLHLFDDYEELDEGHDA